MDKVSSVQIQTFGVTAEISFGRLGLFDEPDTDIAKKEVVQMSGTTALSAPSLMKGAIGVGAIVECVDEAKGTLGCRGYVVELATSPHEQGNILVHFGPEAGLHTGRTPSEDMTKIRYYFWEHQLREEEHWDLQQASEGIIIAYDLGGTNAYFYPHEIASSLYVCFPCMVEGCKNKRARRIFLVIGSHIHEYDVCAECGAVLHGSIVKERPRRMEFARTMTGS